MALQLSERDLNELTALWLNSKGAKVEITRRQLRNLINDRDYAIREMEAAKAKREPETTERLF